MLGDQYRADPRIEEEDLVAKYVARDREVRFIRWGPHLLEKDAVKLVEDMVEEMLDAKTKAKLAGQPLWDLQRAAWREQLQGQCAIRAVYRDRFGDHDKTFHIKDRVVLRELDNPHGDGWVEARVKPLQDVLREQMKQRGRW